MRKIAIQNLKGGTGKTTTTINLAHALANEGKRVLIIDTDVQGNVAASLGLKRDQAPTGIYELLINDHRWESTVVKPREWCDLIASNHTLAVAELQLAGFPRREEVLSVRLKTLTGYDFVLIDCGPSLSLLHQNVLLFADELLIPISTEYLAMLGAQQIFQSLAFLLQYFERAPRVLGILPTLFDQRTNVSCEVLAAIEETYRGISPVLPAIPVDTKLGQASAKRKTIFEHAPQTRAAEAYAKLAQWVMAHEAQAPVRTEVPAAPEAPGQAMGAV
jgi:chromosome partitioning protein